MRLLCLAFCHRAKIASVDSFRVRARRPRFGSRSRDLWILTSSGESAYLAAHFGIALSYAQFINPVGGPEAIRLYKERFRPSLQCWSCIICVRKRSRTRRFRNFIACCGQAECFLRLKFATVGFSAPVIFAARLFRFLRHRHSRGSLSWDSRELPSISNAPRFVSARCVQQKPEIILNDIPLRTSFGLQFITLASLTGPGAFSSIL